MPLPSQTDKVIAPNDLAACRDLLRGGSLSFHAASLLLPARVRDPASALYAFCRVADDAVDNGGNAPAALAELRERLDHIYRGRPIDHAPDRAFAAVVAAYAIPRALPEALLEGFEWDLAARRYETIEELEGYAARVAGCVGAMMTLVMGRRDAAVLARACELGIAMQLTNICRDVGEDARAGRVYLPLTWLRDAGIDADRLVARPEFSPALGRVVQRVLARADTLYSRAAPAIAALPVACRPAIHAARILYAEIGREVERRGLDSVSQRAVVAPARKMQVLLRVLSVPLFKPDLSPVPSLAAAQFLIDAMPAMSDGSPARSRLAPWNRIHDRAIWLIDLFERLERRSQPERAG